MEEEICMPGVTYMNTHTLMREDLPSDLMIKLDLQKVDPFPMTVPCLEGVGSCEYDICKVMMMMMMMMVMIMYMRQIITDAGDSLCQYFPESQPCGCPLLKGDMYLENIELQVRSCCQNVATLGRLKAVMMSIIADPGYGGRAGRRDGGRLPGHSQVLRRQRPRGLHRVHQLLLQAEPVLTWARNFYIIRSLHATKVT